jgi:hypothetical protein
MPDSDPVLEMVRSVRGTAPRLAKALGILPGGIWQWKKVPGRHVLQVEQLLNIPRHLIRPDLYPVPGHPQATRSWIEIDVADLPGVLRMLADAGVAYSVLPVPERRKSQQGNGVIEKGR